MCACRLLPLLLLSLLVPPSPAESACWPPSDVDALPDCLIESLASDPGGNFWIDPEALSSTERERAAALRAAVTAMPEPDDPVAAASRAELIGWWSRALGDATAERQAFRRALELDDGIQRVSWIDPDGATLHSTALGLDGSRLARIVAGGGEHGTPEARAAGDAERVAIEAELWRERLPAGTIELTDGRRVSLADERRGALLLDFWATWCAPCREELPQIDALYRHEREAGLEAIALNVDESEAVAIEFARSLDVEMPVAVAEPALIRRLGVDTLPVLILADRAGNILGRWDGYRPGVAREAGRLFEQARASEVKPAERQTIGSWQGGLLQPRVEWSRSTGASALGVAPFVTSSGGLRIVAVVERGMIVFEADGRVQSQRKTTRFSGRLESDAASGLVAHREGATRALALGTDGGERLIDIGAPLLDVAVDGKGNGAAATLDGLFLFDVDDPYGGSVRRVEGIALASSVSFIDGAWLVLGPGALHRVAADGSVGAPTALPAAAWSLIVGGADGRVGVAPELVLDHAVGRFVVDGPQVAALALRDGRLLLVDPADGRELSQSRFDDLSDLATVDLDGDGIDELAVTHGPRLSLLSWERSASAVTGKAD